jgi:hypothetical protein
MGIWPDLLQRNPLRWVLARDNKSIIIGTMMRRNKQHSKFHSTQNLSTHAY